jgi:glycosyltransferase involved in cell wall biosynthesis
MLIGIEASHANKPNRTGVEEYSFQVIQALKKIIPVSDRVVLYSSSPLQGGLEVLPSHWQSKVLSWSFKKMWTQARLTSEFVLKKKPDVFFAPGQLIPLFTPHKTVVTLHDSAFKIFPQAYNFLGRKYLELMNVLVLKKAAHILTPSEFSKQEIFRIYGHVKTPITVTPLAYNSEIFNFKEDSDAQIQSVLQKYALQKKFLISIGRLEQKKNTVKIIEAFNEIKQKNDYQLVLIGKPGVGYSEIKKAIDSSPYKNDIKELGFVPSGDAALLLRHALVFVFPSLYEGFGLPVLEALSSGCPVVASTGNSLEEVGGSIPLYVNPRNVSELVEAISILIQNKDLREQKKNAGLEHVKNFSWQKTALKTWEVISNC